MKNATLIRFLSVATLGLAVAGCEMMGEDNGLFATSAAERPCSNFGMIDFDNSGIITPAEWSGFRNGVFNDWDMNDDRRLDRAEYDPCWRAGGFMNAGFNGDEWNDSFGVFDGDDDGFLSGTEFFGDDEFGVFDRDRDFGIELGIGEWGF